jgi:hypothetical protein
MVETRMTRWKVREVISTKSNSGIIFLKLKAIDKAIENEENWVAHPLEEVKPIARGPLRWLITCL